MSEKTNVHVQQTVEAWKNLVEQQACFWDSILDGVSQFGAKGLEQSFGVLDQTVDTTKTAVTKLAGLSLVAPGLEALQSVAPGPVAAVQPVVEAAGKVKEEGAKLSCTMLDEGAKLTKESLSFGRKVTEVWREAAFESSRQLTSWMPPTF